MDDFQDILSMQCKGNELLRLDIVIRLLAIENYYGKNDYGFELYVSLSIFRYLRKCGKAWDFCGSVNMLRNSFKYANYSDLKKFSNDFKAVYNAPNEAAAYFELESLKEKWGKSIRTPSVTGRTIGKM